MRVVIVHYVDDMIAMGDAALKASVGRRTPPRPLPSDRARGRLRFPRLGDMQRRRQRDPHRDPDRIRALPGQGHQLRAKGTPRSTGTRLVPI